MPAPVPFHDITLVIPELRELRERTDAFDHAAVDSILDRIEGRDEGQLFAASETVVTARNGAVLLARHGTVTTNQTRLRTLQAHAMVIRAWEVRTHHHASYVAADQFERFAKHLQEAEQILIDVCAREPRASLPWCLRLMTARGLELGMSEARRRYDRLTEHHPRHFVGHAQLLQRLCPKWGGSWDEAFAFARKSAKDAPIGSNLPALVAQAHLEQWLETAKKDQRSYLNRVDVRSEVDEAAAASVLHADYQPGFDWVTAHTLFGILYALAGDVAAATPHFQALGEVVAEGAWGYLAEEAAPVSKIRAAAMKGAQR